MKKRFLSLVALLAMLFSCLPLSAVAIDRIDREDTENIAYKDTVLPEDLWLHEYNGNNNVSSSGNNINDNRWTKFSGRDSIGVMTDPTNPNNKVGYLAGKGSPCSVLCRMWRNSIPPFRMPGRSLRHGFRCCPFL